MHSWLNRIGHYTFTIGYSTINFIETYIKRIWSKTNKQYRSILNVAKPN